MDHSSQESWKSSKAKCPLSGRNATTPCFGWTTLSLASCWSSRLTRVKEIAACNLKKQPRETPKRNWTRPERAGNWNRSRAKDLDPWPTRNHSQHTSPGKRPSVSSRSQSPRALHTWAPRTRTSSAISKARSAVESKTPNWSSCSSSKSLAKWPHLRRTKLCWKFIGKGHNMFR